jgi:type IV secretory pathway VirB10-like protein
LLVAAVVFLALMVGGVGAAVLLTQGEDDPSPSTNAANTGGEPTTPATPGTSTAELPAAGNGEEDTTPAPEPSGPSRAEEIEEVLTDYYAAVKSGDYDSAWELLSPSYKEWKEGEGGYAKWQTQEERNFRWLRPNDLTVDVREYDPSTRIATIYVSGMTYKRPGNALCDYVGITWARRFGGRWYYDQGYVQRAERAAEWRPRATETLGYACEVDGY